MKTTLLLLPLLLTGCATTGPSAERGPSGTVAYHVQIETDEPGMNIEVENNYVGKSPLQIKIYGDKDGTFHNFGSQEYIIRAIPPKEKPGLHTQTKIFRTGGWFSQEDRVPSRIQFYMSQPDQTAVPPKY